MVAPGVASERLTVWFPVYWPEGSENSGVAAAEEVEPTVMGKSSCSAVPLPQHLTCSVCDPALAVTDAVNEVGSITAEPLSME